MARPKSAEAGPSRFSRPINITTVFLQHLYSIFDGKNGKMDVFGSVRFALFVKNLKTGLFLER